MIIGNGDLATVLKEVQRSDLWFFASGVSNSQEERKEEYEREKELLKSQPYDCHLVYFSSLGVFFSDTRYINHKREMESIVKTKFAHYTIVRLGNITWGTNPHTFINAYRIKPYVVKDEYRYIIDKDEFLDWIKAIPNWSCEMNVQGRRMKIIDALKEYGNA